MGVCEDVDPEPFTLLATDTSGNWLPSAPLLLQKTQAILHTGKGHGVRLRKVGQDPEKGVPFYALRPLYRLQKPAGGNELNSLFKRLKPFRVSWGTQHRVKAK